MENFNQMIRQVIIPQELDSMGFGNLGMTLAYLESTENAAAKSKSAADANATKSNP